MGEVNAQVVLDRAAEQRVQGHSQTLGFDIPERHVDGREARHQRRTVAPAGGHVVNAIPMRLRSGGIETYIFRFQPAQYGFGYVSTAFEGGFAQPGNPRIRVHLDKHQVAPAHGNLVNVEAGDFDFSQRTRGLKGGSQRDGRETLKQGPSVQHPGIISQCSSGPKKVSWTGVPEEPFMGHKFANILETVGNTPVVRINKLAPPGINLFVKVEAFNPLGSVKDRLALGVIEDAEKTGKLKPGQTVIEATSGNTGIGLAMVCAQKGYPLVVTMAETFSIERRKLMRFLGAKVVLTPAAGRGFGMVSKADRTGRSAWLVSHPPVRK